MKISQPRHLRPWQNAFTMIEIAIALAVIAFALVAVLGILPTGLTAQKENREETIINNDGPYFLEAIRSGGRGFEHLTNYVDSISIVTTNPPANPVITLVYTNSGDLDAVAGSNIIGRLSHPVGVSDGTNGNVEKIVARVRALSGSAVETGGASPDFAFAYQLTTEIFPLNWNTNAPAISAIVASDVASTNSAEYLKSLQANLYEIRITCRWPLLPGGKVGPNRKTFRALVSGKLNNEHKPRYFFETQNFQKAL